MKQNVFVIIVAYNGEPWLRKNLESLRNSTYSVKTIVVDNCSTDHSVNVIKSFAEVELIRSTSNLGFGKANNLGIKEAEKRGADYVFLLNQDAWVFPDTIGKLIEKARDDSKYGIISPFHLSGDGVTPDNNFETYLQRKTATISPFIAEVPFVNAAAWLIPIRVILKIGDFEPMFSHYGEDRNFVNRLHFHGYKVIVVKDAKICHDRVIRRNFKKDVIQSKFLMLNQVLDINKNVLSSYFIAFKSVLGLPKYFLGFYSIGTSLRFFYILFLYFIQLKFKIFTILKKRRSYI